jgi:hypothetical protein
MPRHPNTIAHMPRHPNTIALTHRHPNAIALVLCHPNVIALTPRHRSHDSPHQRHRTLSNFSSFFNIYFCWFLRGPLFLTFVSSFFKFFSLILLIFFNSLSF